MRKKIVAVMAAIGISLGLGITLAAPASAAMHSNCKITNISPRTDGNTIFATTTVVCGDPYGAGAVQVGNQIVENNVIIRKPWAYKYSGPVPNLSITQTFNCNGFGTDLWKTNHYGKTNNNGSTMVASPNKSLTC